MTDKARELLEMAIEEWDSDRDLYEFHKVMEEIRAYLAEPEVKREALSSSEMAVGFEWEPDAYECEWTWFRRGVRFAEKHHGIGGGDE